MAWIPEPEELSTSPQVDRRSRHEYETRVDRHGGRRGDRPDPEAERRKRRRAYHSPHDVATVHGIPAAQFTEPVRNALADLMDEITALRGEVERLHAREGHLLAEADAHPLYPVLNRRAFMREVGRAISYVTRTRGPAVLAVFAFDDLSRLRRGQGRFPAEALMQALAEKLRGELRETDVAGCPGDDGLAAVLAPTEHDAAEEKLAFLAHALGGVVVPRGGARLATAVRWGMHPLSAGESAEEALEAADRDLRRA